ncbi:hypothetical protein GCM10023310_70080 [Paenibacillus vulneris]
MKLDVFEEGKLYFLKLNDGEHYAKCLIENDDHSYTFIENDRRIIVTPKNLIHYLKISQ